MKSSLTYAKRESKTLLILALHRFDFSGLPLGALLCGSFQPGEKGEKCGYVMQVALQK